jgi:hypothetical protein
VTSLNQRGPRWGVGGSSRAQGYKLLIVAGLLAAIGLGLVLDEAPSLLSVRFIAGILLLTTGAALGVRVVVGTTRFAKWRLRRMPTTAIEGMRSKRMAKLTGRVRLTSQPLHAPVSTTPCAFYRVRVVDLNEDGEEAMLYTARAAAAVPFALHDATGLVEVDASVEAFRLDDTGSWSYGQLSSAQLARIAECTGLTPGELADAQVFECSLAEDATVTVLAHAHAPRGVAPPDTSGPYRDPPSGARVRGTLVVTGGPQP